MTSEYHDQFIRSNSLSSRFIDFTEFEPLDVDEYKALSQVTQWEGMSDTSITRLWIQPVSRYIQQLYRIDQTEYDAGTDPTLTELEEDFRIAVALTIDRWILNEDEVHGSQAVPGAGSVTWDQKLPARAKALLERYRRPGGKIGRA